MMVGQNIENFRHIALGSNRKIQVCDHLAGHQDMGADVYACIQIVKAKPFSPDFTAQAEAATTLYGSDLRFFFTVSDISELLQDLDKLYDTQTIQRAETVLREQMRKYSYLFVKK